MRSTTPSDRTWLRPTTIIAVLLMATINNTSETAAPAAAPAPAVPEEQPQPVPPAEEAPAAEAAAAERAPLEAKYIQQYSRGGRALTSSLWTDLRELRGDHPQMAKGFNFVCVRKVDGGCCNTFIRLGMAKGKPVTSRGIDHAVECHPTSPVALAAGSRRTKIQDGAENKMFDAGMLKAGGSLECMALSKADLSLTGQVRFFVYCSMKVHKAVIEDGYYRDMIIDVSGGSSPLLGKVALERFLDGEFATMLNFERYMVKLGYEKAQGNAFCMHLHDGGTLPNHLKYQAYAIQMVDPLWRKNLVFALALRRCADSTDKAVATLLEDVCNERLGLKLKDIGLAMRADVAACGVAARLDMPETEPCGMHQGDKVGAAAIGQLVRSKQKKAINAFPEGVQLMQRCRNIAKHFSYGSKRIGDLKDLCKVTEEAGIKPCVDLNKTRIAAPHRLLYSLLRQPRALTMYETKTSNNLKLTWTAPSKFWHGVAEFEAILYVSQKTSKLSQIEQYFCSAYFVLIKALTLNALRGKSLPVVDLTKPTTNPILPRAPKKYDDFSEAGRTCWQRALLECERRFCGNVTEDIDEAPLVMSDREKISMLLDLRTTKATHVTAEVLDESKQAFYDFYASWMLRAEEYKQEKAAEQQKFNGKRAVDNEGGAEPKAKKGKKDPSIVGISYDAKGHSESESEEEEPEEAEESAEAKLDRLKKDGKTKLRAWRKICVDWQAEFPDQIHSNEDLDLMDLMTIDIGKLYLKYESLNNPDYGVIPILATSSYGQFGALNAEGFCERILRATNQVMDKGNTLLSDPYLEKLTLLRINRPFMEHMRHWYNHLSKQDFGMTVVRSGEVPSTPKKVAARRISYDASGISYDAIGQGESEEEEEEEMGEEEEGEEEEGEEEEDEELELDYEQQDEP